MEERDAILWRNSESSPSQAILVHGCMHQDCIRIARRKQETCMNMMQTEGIRHHPSHACWNWQNAYATFMNSWHERRWQYDWQIDRMTDEWYYSVCAVWMHAVMTASINSFMFGFGFYKIQTSSKFGCAPILRSVTCCQLQQSEKADRHPCSLAFP